MNLFKSQMLNALNLRMIFRLLMLPGILSTARAGLPPVMEQEIVSGHYTYVAGWDSLVPESAGAHAGANGTFFGDVEHVSGFSVGNDPANGVRTVNVRPGVKSAVLEYKFDFSQTSSRVIHMSVRDALRLESEPGNWATIAVYWQADDKGEWTELRSLNSTRFMAPPARVSGITVSSPASVIRYRVVFTSEEPVAHKWGRARWNYLKKESADESAFQIEFTLAKAGTAVADTPVTMQATAQSTPPDNGSPWGISSHPLRKSEWGSLDTLMKRVNEAGMTSLREDFSFTRFLSKGGEWDFSKFDVLVDSLTRSGVGTVGILSAYDNDLRVRGLSDLVPIHQHPEAWRRYVRTVVGRYHDRVHHWVIWNEQDGGFWGVAPNADEYVSLLKICHEEIKAIDPTAKVILGGLSYWNTNYLRAVYRAGGKGLFDIVGVHRYGEGPDSNAKIARTMREFRALMAEQGHSDMPVWILESGGSTFESPLLSQQPLFMEKAIRIALARINRSVTKETPLRVGIVASPRTAGLDEAAPQRKWLPGVELTLIKLDDLSRLDPADCPVLLSDDGLHIDEPMLEPLRAYVERGGLLVAVGHPPFYVLHTRDTQGIWQSRDAVGETYPFFRMGFVVSWNTKGVPEQTENVFVPPQATAAGLPPVSDVYVKHFFSAKNLRPGDGYLPLLSAQNEKGETFGDPVALYTYKDWKGGILACAVSLGGGWSEEEQARLIPRIYLSYLGMPESGVEKIFLYDLHDDGLKKGEREHNFGLTRWDWSPKPAFAAYREMVEALGKAPKFVRRLSGGTDSDWALVFRRAEDQSLVLAAWSVRPKGTFGVLREQADVILQVEGEKVQLLQLGKEEDLEKLKVCPYSS